MCEPSHFNCYIVYLSFIRLSTPNPRTYIGSGKVAEIKTAIQALDVETVIFDDELSPGSVFTCTIQLSFVTILYLKFEYSSATFATSFNHHCKTYLIFTSGIPNAKCFNLNKFWSYNL